MVSRKLPAGIGIAIALLAIVIFLPKLSFVQPRGTHLTDADRATAESNLRGHLLQALAGLVLGVGAYFTWRTFALNREGQITERFTRAVEQLANKDQLDIRLGGIYALERIAHDSETHYEPVLEVLTAFLRENARGQPEGVSASPEATSQPTRGTPPGEERAFVIPDLRTDHQAAATVLGRRNRRHERDGYRLDLRGVDLRKASLHAAHLELAHLGAAHLEEANLNEAHLEGANLSAAHLEGADLSSAHLKGTFFEGAYLEKANLNVANLEGAWLNKAHLKEAHLYMAHLDGAVLLGADLEGAELTQDQLADAITDDQTRLPA
jgi:uncharacterized protein YjbI with pentapeptide repeats